MTPIGVIGTKGIGQKIFFVLSVVLSPRCSHCVNSVPHFFFTFFHFLTPSFGFAGALPAWAPGAAAVGVVVTTAS